jgi:transposase InsO family protein
VLELRDQFPVVKLVEFAGLPRSTFYNQCKILAATDKYAELKERIRVVFTKNVANYGYRRVADALRVRGEATSRNTIQRLMQAMELRSLVRPKVKKAFKGSLSEAAPNLMDRKFSASQMNTKWVTDVTEFNVAGGRLYLSPVMDLFNGEILDYEMSDRPKFALVTNMLRKVFRRIKAADRPILHSDQGWQYRMPLYQALLKQHGVTQSMSRKGNCYDNAPMESFFAILKTEYFHRNKFTSFEQLRKGIARYIKYYNEERIKTKLGGLSPIQFRLKTP